MANAADIDVAALALSYAAFASDAGWSNKSLRRFLDMRGYARDDQRLIWPDGMRSAARSLNAAADAEMVQRWLGGQAQLIQIIDQRFADNRLHKRSVARLAGSDFFHPVDTMTRTALTAHQMIACRGGYRARSAVGRWIERWSLVLVYSVCVLVWLGDDTPDQRRTGAMTRSLVGLIRAN